MPVQELGFSCAALGVGHGRSYESVCVIDVQRGRRGQNEKRRENRFYKSGSPRENSPEKISRKLTVN